MVSLSVSDPSWLVFSGGFDHSLPRRLSKRFFDVVAAMSLLLLSWPVMVLVALCVKLESPGPMLYRQVRVGELGQEFELVKFRSMRADAEADGVARWASRQDDRSTRVGRFIRKTRLDELPQLLNVLRGEMSFVGPRPERPQFVSMLAEQVRYYNVRHSIKPGLTGWAQVRYPYGASVSDAEEKLKFDLFYVKNHGLLLDLLILMTSTLQQPAERAARGKRKKRGYAAADIRMGACAPGFRRQVHRVTPAPANEHASRVAHVRGAQCVEAFGIDHGPLRLFDGLFHHRDVIVVGGRRCRQAMLSSHGTGENLVDHADAPTRGDAQVILDVLGRAQAFIEAADVLEHFAAHHCRDGRQRGVVEKPSQDPSISWDYVSAVEDVDALERIVRALDVAKDHAVVRMLRQPVGLSLRLVGKPRVVAVEESEEITTRQAHAVVASRGNSGVGLPHVPQPFAEEPCISLAQHVGGIVGGAVVDNDDFVGRTRLREHGIERARQDRAAVVRRYDRRHQEGLRHAC
jgi:lipopolysaccharide/colanic/teichoic acid biosynthesis glycosyltransferase